MSSMQVQTNEYVESRQGLVCHKCFLKYCSMFKMILKQILVIQAFFLIFLTQASSTTENPWNCFQVMFLLLLVVTLG